MGKKNKRIKELEQKNQTRREAIMRLLRERWIKYSRRGNIRKKSTRYRTPLAWWKYPAEIEPNQFEWKPGIRFKD